VTRKAVGSDNRDRFRLSHFYAKCELFDALGIRQDSCGEFQNGLGLLGQSSNTVPGASQQWDTEFLLKLHKLSADAGLRSMQQPRGFRDIETCLDYRHKVPKLLKFQYADSLSEKEAHYALII
jgi:hypothetical protein